MLHVCLDQDRINLGYGLYGPGIAKLEHPQQIAAIAKDRVGGQTCLDLKVMEEMPDVLTHGQGLDPLDDGL